MEIFMNKKLIKSKPVKIKKVDEQIEWQRKVIREDLADIKLNYDKE